MDAAQELEREMHEIEKAVGRLLKGALKESPQLLQEASDALSKLAGLVKVERDRYEQATNRETDEREEEEERDEQGDRDEPDERDGSEGQEEEQEQMPQVDELEIEPDELSLDELFTQDSAELNLDELFIGDGAEIDLEKLTQGSSMDFGSQANNRFGFDFDGSIADIAENALDEIADICDREI